MNASIPSSSGVSPTCLSICDQFPRPCNCVAVGFSGSDSGIVGIAKAPIRSEPRATRYPSSSTAFAWGRDLAFCGMQGAKGSQSLARVVVARPDVFKLARCGASAAEDVLAAKGQ